MRRAWSVRQIERTYAKDDGGTATPKHVDEVKIDPNVKAAIQEMERVLGTKVRIVEKAQRGRGRSKSNTTPPKTWIASTTAIVGEP